MILDLGFLILLAAGCVGPGLRLSAWLGARAERPGQAVAYALALGLGFLSLGVLALGEMGILTPWGLALLATIGLAMGDWPATLALLPRAGFPPNPVDWRDWLGPLSLAVILIGTLATALGPVTDGDALCYHLQVPKLFLADGSVGFDPDLHETVYPLVAESLDAVALATRGPTACRLVQWLMGLLLALVTIELARPVLHQRACWAGVIALGVPAISNGMSSALNDVALAALGNAALLSWSQWRRGGGGSLAHAGTLAGLALGVKYPALVWTAVLALATVWATLQHRRTSGPAASSPTRSRLRRLALNLALFCSPALLIGAPWYARAYHHTGNPVYPFFRTTFGGSGLDEVLDPIKRPLPVTPWNLATALAPMTLEPDRFDSFSHQLGPVFLLFLPGLLLERPPAAVIEPVVIALAFLTLCLTQRQSMRFVLLIVGPLAIGVAWLLAQWWRRGTRPARVLCALALLIVAMHCVQAAARARHGLSVLCGAESAAAFLQRREPSYVLGRWVDANLPLEARLIGQDHRGFYIPRPYTMELAHRRRTGLGARGEPASQIIDTLRSRGFTHLVLCPPTPLDAVEFDPTLQRRLAPWLDSHAPLWQSDLCDADGVTRTYSVYRLDEAPAGRIARRAQQELMR